MELLKSRLHMGTGARVQRVLNRAMSGAPITISVLGGSSKSYPNSPIGHPMLARVSSIRRTQR